MIGTLIAMAGILVLNALFAAAEFGAISARRSRIRQRAEAGSKLAKRFLPVVEDPRALDRYISACQLGITVSSLSLGAIGEARLAEFVRSWFAGQGSWQTGLAHSLATGIVLVAVTALQVVLAEQVPKSLALQFPNRTAIYTVLPVLWTLRLLSPLLALFDGSSQAILRLLRAPLGRDHHLHSAEEIDLLITDSREGGHLEPEEERRLLRALKLGTRTVRQIMVPRSRISAIDATIPTQQAIDRVLDSKFTRVPVYERSLDEVIGIVHAKELLHQHLLGNPPDLRLALLPVVIVPDLLPADHLIGKLREQKSQIALVVDAGGRIVGLVTLEDVLADVFGDAEVGGDALAERLPNGRVRLSGAMRLAEAAPWIGTRWRGRTSTVGGHVVDMLGHFASSGETVTIDGVEVTVERVTKNRMVASVIATPVTKPESD